MHETAQYAFSKDKLPDTYSYPMRRSLLDAALTAASAINAVYSVRFLYGRGKGPAAIEVLFSPEGRNKHVSVSGKSLVTIWAVRREIRKACEDIFLEQGLPILCHWLVKSQNAVNSWRGGDHALSLSVENGMLTKRES